jgi:hypothetical protein
MILLKYTDETFGKLKVQIEAITKDRDTVVLHQVSSARFPDNHFTERTEFVIFQTETVTAALMNLLIQPFIFIGKKVKIKSPIFIIVSKTLTDKDFEPLECRYYEVMQKYAYRITA